MDLPQAPKDMGLRNIIDKLAEFVSRNGPEFEAITKAKQQGNPRFSFLYGGEYYQYYQWRVSSEQAMLKQQASLPQTQQQQTSLQQPQQQPQLIPHNILSAWPTKGPQPSVTVAGGSLQSQIDAIVVQQKNLQEQIIQSEQNLTAQEGVLLQQQKIQIEKAIDAAQSESIFSQAEEQDIHLTEFDAILQPIIDSCTKDSISAGKNWILQHTSDTSKCNVLLQYLLRKAFANGATFNQKLHLIYLVNDVLHHCVRKHADNLKNSLENIVIPMFCSAEIIANEEQKTKLHKLLSLWESKSNLFDACVISKLRSPTSSMQEYKTSLLNTNQSIVSAIQQTTQSTFENYKQQHQVFTQHASHQIVMLDNQKLTLVQQQKNALVTKQIPPLMPPGCDVPMINNSSNPVVSAHNNNFLVNNSNESRNTSGGPVPLMSQKIAMPGSNMPFPPPASQAQTNFASDDNYDNFQSSCLPASIFNISQAANPPAPSNNYQIPPPNFLIPDLSKPPPGFMAPATPGSGVLDPVAITAAPPEEIKPTAPYYELPAGLMVPLIRLEDCNYKPLNSDDVRLPAPGPPNERLIQAIEAFYSPPSHDRPRDGEGWEKLGLYEYYKVKNAARKVKDDEVEKGVRTRSRSPSPIYIEVVKPKRINKRFYRSKSRSRSRSKSSSKSPSPTQRRGNSNRYWPRSPKHSNNSPAPRRSPSPPPVSNSKRDRNRDRDRDRDRENDREWERDRREKSPRSPAAAFMSEGFAAKNQPEYIEESNKGHQMLMKMGWAGSGTGLGAQRQGIDVPISGGEVREKHDLYKGVGMSINDPYENFRKNKGAAFIHRMRSRDHERKKSKTHANVATEEPTVEYDY